MANEDKKDFNAMLARRGDFPKIQVVTDPKTIEKYGGNRMFFAGPMTYSLLMAQVPEGRLVTVGALRAFLAEKNGADFTDPITAGIFVSIAAWASHQRDTDNIPYWRTLKANGELNPKFPGGVEDLRRRLEAEGHTVRARGRTNIRYVVQDYEESLMSVENLAYTREMPR